MAGHTGLHKVIKTVKGKKGSVQRAYWVSVAKAAGAVAGIQAAGAATHNIHAYGASALGSQFAAAKIIGKQVNKGSLGRRFATGAALGAGSVVGTIGGFIAGNAIRMGAGRVAETMRSNRMAAQSARPSPIKITNARVSTNPPPTRQLGRAPYQLHAHSRGGPNSNTHGY